MTDEIDDFLVDYAGRKRDEEAQKQGVDPSFARRIAGAESSGRADIVGGRKLSRAGAVGQMQLMPGTAKDLGVDPYSLEDNARGGVKYLKQNLDSFGGDQAKAAAAYNAGPGAVRKYGGVPPYKETRGYVKKTAGQRTPPADEVDDFLSTYQSPRAPSSKSDVKPLNPSVASKQTAPVPQPDTSLPFGTQLPGASGIIKEARTFQQSPELQQRIKRAEEVDAMPAGKRLKYEAGTAVKKGLLQVNELGQNINDLITNPVTTLREGGEAAGRALLKYGAAFDPANPDATYEAASREQTPQIEAIQRQKQARREAMPDAGALNKVRQRVSEGEEASQGFPAKIGRGIISGAIGTAPQLALGAAGGGVGAIAELTAAGADLTRPEEAAASIAGTILPVKAARTLTPAINEAASILPGRVAQSIGRGAGQLAVGGGTNVAQSALTGERDPEALAEQFITGAALAGGDAFREGRALIPRPQITTRPGEGGTRITNLGAGRPGAPGEPMARPQTRDTMTAPVFDTTMGRMASPEGDPHQRALVIDALRRQPKFRGAQQELNAAKDRKELLASLPTDIRQALTTPLPRSGPPSPESFGPPRKRPTAFDWRTAEQERLPFDRPALIGQEAPRQPPMAAPTTESALPARMRPNVPATGAELAPPIEPGIASPIGETPVEAVPRQRPGVKPPQTLEATPTPEAQAIEQPQVEQITEPDRRSTVEPSSMGTNDPRYAEAKAVSEQRGKVSTALIQRTLRIGFNRAEAIKDAILAERAQSQPPPVEPPLPPRVIQSGKAVPTTRPAPPPERLNIRRPVTETAPKPVEAPPAEPIQPQGVSPEIQRRIDKIPSLTNDGLDDFIRKLEGGRNTDITGERDLGERDRANNRALQEAANNERKARVARKEMPAKYAKPEGPIDYIYKAQRAEDITQPIQEQERRIEARRADKASRMAQPAESVPQMGREKVTEQAEPPRVRPGTAQPEPSPAETSQPAKEPYATHQDFGPVALAENQAGVARGKVRVNDADGAEHIINKRGKNQRAIIQKETGAETGTTTRQPVEPPVSEAPQPAPEVEPTPTPTPPRPRPMIPQDAPKATEGAGFKYGDKVEYNSGRKVIKGWFEGVNRDGSLRVRDDAGEIVHVKSEAIRPQGEAPKPPQPRATAPKPEDGGRSILKGMLSVDPEVKTGALVSLSELRAHLGAKMSKADFDAEVLKLADDGQIVLHRHVFPESQTPEELAGMVRDDQGNYFVGAAVREEKAADVFRGIEAGARQPKRSRFTVGSESTVPETGGGTTLGAGFGGLQSGFGRRQPKQQAPTTPAPRKSILETARERQAAARAPRQARKPAASTVEPPGILDKVSAFRKAGLLLGVPTHLKNLIGNTVFQGAEEVARVPGSLADVAMSAFTKQRGVTLGNPLRIAQAGYEGAKQGLADAAKVWKEGSNGGQQAAGQRQSVRYDNKILDTYVNKSFDALNAEDAFYKGYAVRRSLEDRARATARTELMQRKIGKNELNSRIQELVKAPTTEMAAGAVADAETALFQNKNRISSGVGKFKAELGKGGAFGMDMILPFDKTPTNIILRTLDYSPAGYARAVRPLVKAAMNKAMTAEEQRAFSTAIGRATTGTGIIALGGILAAKGMVTGFYDKEEAKKTGAPPGSLILGGRSYAIAPLGPVGLLLTLGATLHREGTRPLKDPGERSNRVLKGAASVAGQLPFLESTKELNDAVTGDRSITTAAGRMASSFVPQFVGTAAKLADTDEREAKGFVAPTQARIPGLRNYLPANKRRMKTEWSDVVDPFQSRPVRRGGR